MSDPVHAARIAQAAFSIVAKFEAQRMLSS
jgi:hypothetical protein